MKPSHLLPFCSAITTAKNPSSAQLLSYGAGRSQDLLGMCEQPLCLNNPLANTVSDSASSFSAAATTDRELAASLWAHSTPCMANGTLEYCVYSNPDFAGRGISILTSPSRAVEIARSAAFARPLGGGEEEGPLNAAESPRWKVAMVPGKGMGLIATRNLEAGDHIMSSTPSIMVDYNLFSHASDAVVKQLEVAAADYLPSHHRGAFLNLSTHDDATDYESQVSKIILTNSFDIQQKDIVTKKESEDDYYYTVFPEISRMNHDCRPNADYYFDPDTLAQHIHAVHPIAAGDEISISYIDPVQTRTTRLQRLDYSWHFPCSCRLCTASSHQTEASDARVRQIVELRKQFRNWGPDSQATPAMGDLLVSLYEQERLWNIMHEAYTFAAIEYNGAGEPWTATKYARLAIQRGLLSGGPQDHDVLEMKALARDPWSHWSWMLRAKRRMNWVSNISE